MVRKLISFTHLAASRLGSLVLISCLLGAFPSLSSAITLKSLTLTPTAVYGGNASTGKVTLSAKAPSGGTIVTLTSSKSVASVPSSVMVAAGLTTASFAVSTTPGSTNTTAVIKGVLGASSASATLTIQAPKLVSITFTPSTIEGGNTTVAKVLIGSPAPDGGLTVTLKSSFSGFSVPATLTIPGGATQANFSSVAPSVTASKTVTVTCKAGGSSVSGSVSIKAASLGSLTLSPSSVTGGATSTGTITLAGQAPAGGIKVVLKSSSQTATVPSSVVVPAGSTTSTFTISTTQVSTATSAKITATYGAASSSATLSINVVSLASVSFSPSSVLGGSNSVGTVTLSGAAPAQGVTVSLSSNQGSVVVPSNIVVPSGSSSATFTATTQVVTGPVSAVISASYASSQVTGTLSVNPFSLSKFTISPSSVTGGVPTTGTITLGAPAPSSGISVSLSSNSANAGVPGSVTITPGATSATFSIATQVVSSQSTAVITASYAQSSLTASVSLSPYILTLFTLSPNSVLGGANSTGTVTLNDVAPAAGVSVSLTSSSTSILVPATVSVPAGATSATFTVTTQAVATQASGTVTATVASTTLSANLTLTAPTLTGLSLNPTTVQSGSGSTGTITISSAAPSTGLTITLTSNNAAVTVPTSVSVAAGAKTATFKVTTTSVYTQTVATITGVDPSGTSLSAQLTLNIQPVQIIPIQVSDIAFDAVAGNIWVSVPSTGGQYANSVVAVNPISGAIGTVINMGATPNHIRLTDDGQYAYVDCPSDGTVRQANIKTGKAGGIFKSNAGDLYDLETIPGSPNSWVTVGNPQGGVNANVWDIVQGVAVERQNTGAVGYDARFSGNGTLLYGDGGGSLFVDTLTPTAIDWTHQYSIDVHGFVYWNNLLYTAVPNIIDPVQQIVVESIPTTDFFPTNIETNVNANDNRIYYLTWDASHNKRILSFDLSNYTEYPFIDTGTISGGGKELITCGNHIVAFYNFGSGVTQNLIIVRGNQ